MESLCQSVRKIFNSTIKYAIKKFVSFLFAVLTDSPYRTHISRAVLKMQEEGKVQRLKNKWWKEENSG